MKSLKVLVLAVVFGFMVTGISLAADLKIGYVDLSKIFDGYQKTKEFDSVLQTQGAAFQKDRDAMIQKIQDAQSKLSLMKDSEKTALEADIEKQKNDVVAFDKEKRTELAKKRDDKVREILTEIQNIVSDLAKREGYTYVLNDRVMIFGDPQFNVTDEVLKTLNDSYKK
ncbi:MAG: OmpH family outer membrane protein [Candidatus Paceibacterales bacterium]